MTEEGRIVANDLAVIIPVHNRQRLLERAVAGVVGQLQAGVHIVVVDDGSQPPVDAARIAGPQVTLVRVEHGGVSNARNAGVAAVPDARWVTFLDSDDEPMSGWIDEIIASQRSGASMFSCAARYEWDDGTVETPVPVPLWSSPPGAPRAQFLAGTFAVASAVFHAAGGYRAGLRHGENTDLGWRIASVLQERRAACTSTDQPLVRVHSRRVRAEPAVRLESALMVLADPPPMLLADARTLGSYHAIAGDSAWRLGMRRAAVRHFANALRADPRQPRHLARLLRALVKRVPR
ncbi:MAG: glycosyltransferase family 2 protein [Actinomycetota bacterium]|nr:glycosyltransferase family 2 protein [Actinomycetota bacterium]